MDIEDRSEKIVTLARAMLQPTAEPAGPAGPAAPGYSLRTVALAALLSASGAAAAGAFAVEQFRPLNRYEKTELIALIHYAAKMRHLEEQAVRETFLSQFGILSLDDLSRSDMSAARNFLQKYIR